jgi:hypothetical protein
MAETTIQIDWGHVGPVERGDDGRLRLPALPGGGGVYRSRLSLGDRQRRLRCEPEMCCECSRPLAEGGARLNAELQGYVGAPLRHFRDVRSVRLCHSSRMPNGSCAWLRSSIGALH